MQHGAHDFIEGNVCEEFDAGKKKGDHLDASCCQAQLPPLHMAMESQEVDSVITDESSCWMVRTADEEKQPHKLFGQSILDVNAPLPEVPRLEQYIPQEKNTLRGDEFELSNCHFSQWKYDLDFGTDYVRNGKFSPSAMTSDMATRYSATRFLGRNWGKRRKAAKFNNATPSNYCHICSGKRRPVIACSNIKLGTCRKVVCEICFQAHDYGNFQLEVMSDKWICTHCKGTCPKQATCTTYTRVNNTISKSRWKKRTSRGNDRRRKRKDQRTRKIAERASHEDIGTTAEALLTNQEMQVNNVQNCNSEITAELMSGIEEEITIPPEAVYVYLQLKTCDTQQES